VLSNGDKLEPQNRHDTEPMCAWRYSDAQTKKLGGTTYMPRLHDPTRAFWRGLEALLPKATVARTGTGPRAVLSPRLLGWAEQVASRVERGSDPTMQVRAVGLVLGSNNSVVTELVDDRLDLPISVLSDPDGRLSQAAVDTVRDCETAVNALRDLATRLALAGGADPRANDGPKARAAERAYAELDAPFRAWLAQLEDADGLDDAIPRWRVQARRILWGLGQQLVAESGPASWAGRLLDVSAKAGGGKRRILLDAGLANRWFSRDLDKVFPGEPTVTTEVRS
jgi:CRISPR system Cascade subunit CasA